MNGREAERKIGVALGGGGGRAFAHLGVLARLEEAGVTPYCLSGSSMGAVLGALYARDPRADRVIPEILDFFRKSSLLGALARPNRNDGLHSRRGPLGRVGKKLATLSVAAAVSLRRGLRTLHPVARAVDALFPGNGPDIGSLALPFGLNALDLTEGRVRDFAEGPLNPLLKAAVAVGLVFAPFRHDGRDYADAAPICPVPVTLCRKLGAEQVIAVDICNPLDRDHRADTGFDVVRRILSIQSDLLHQAEIAGADIVVKPEVSDIFWGDFSRIDEAVSRGRDAAEAALPLIRALAEKGA
ncbi:MAG: patatin-like phospholipase family protein [Planctomycetota bacterium]|jgi:NTE family protein|nr:patatin-like phospholipase family protein [Planctomycetota bacterium]